MKTLLAVAACAMIASASAGFAQKADDAEAMRRTNEQIRFSQYPPESLRRGEEGIVGVRVTTDRKGRLTECQVIRSSGYMALDSASCDLLLTYGQAKPYLGPDGHSVVREQNGSVIWQLPPDKRPATPPPYTVNASFIASSQSNSERKICKTTMRTGSMADRQKVCLTAREWQSQRDTTQRDVKDMVPRYQSGQ